MRQLLPIRCSELHGPRAGRMGQEAGAPGLRRRRRRRLSFWRLETHCAPPPVGAGRPGPSALAVPPVGAQEFQDAPCRALS